MKTRICIHCGNTFQATQYSINRGWGKCCSRQCLGKVKSKIAKDAETKKCPRCGLIKPRDREHFSFSKGKIKSWCLKCCSAASSDNYLKNHEINKNKMAQARRSRIEMDRAIRVLFDFSGYEVKLPDNIKICPVCKCTLDKYKDYYQVRSHGKTISYFMCKSCAADRARKRVLPEYVREKHREYSKKFRILNSEKVKKSDSDKYKKRKDNGKIKEYRDKKKQDGSEKRWNKTSYEKAKRTGKYTSSILPKAKLWKKLGRDKVSDWYAKDKLRRSGLKDFEKPLVLLKVEQMKLTRELRKTKEDLENGAAGS